MTYEINADNNKSYRSQSAKSAASVAVAWAKRGFRPHAFAIREDSEGRPTARQVDVTTVKRTAAALANA